MKKQIKVGDFWEAKSFPAVIRVEKIEGNIVFFRWPDFIQDKHDRSLFEDRFKFIERGEK